MDDITLHKIQDWESKGENEGSMAATKSNNSSLNDDSLPLRQINDLTGSHQQIISLLSGLFFSSLLLLTSDSSGKGSSNSATRHSNQTNVDGGIGRGNVAPSTGAENASTVLQVFLHDGGEMDTPRAPRFEIVATGVSINSHLAAASVNMVLDLIAEGEATGLKGCASY
jgi:hypothetical protein